MRETAQLDSDFPVQSAPVLIAGDDCSKGGDSFVLSGVKVTRGAIWRFIAERVLPEVPIFETVFDRI